MSLRSSRAAVALAPFLAFLVVTAVPVPTRAQDPNAPTAGTQAQVGSVTFSLGATIGQVGGTAYERVYIPERDFKLSELQWDLEDVAMAGVQVGVGFPGRFRLNLGYRAAVNEGDGDMVDRDWMLEDSVSDDEWTHESRHPDTALDSGTMLDINLDFRALSRGSFSLSGILGYRSSEWEWSARGGDYIYTWDDNGDGFITGDEYRADRGSFPAGELLITYRQAYEMPYLGLGCEGAMGPVQVQGHVLYSPWVSAEDEDHHFRGAREYEGDFSGGSWFGAAISAHWFFAPQWYATMSVEYEKYDEIIGDVTLATPEGRWTYQDSAGVEMETVLLLLGAGFRF